MSEKEARVRVFVELPEKPVKTIECLTVNEAVRTLLAMKIF
jgi:hypothetical protein